MLYPEWRGLRVLPAEAALRELARLHFSLDDAVEVLEGGYDCARSRRARNVFERCVRRGGKTIKIVVARSFNRFRGKDCWVIIHAGKFK